MYDYKAEQQSKKILHYTIGRSGSTFITQILKHIFGDKNVWAGHEPILFKIKPEQKLFITIRDFRDVSASMWRVHLDVPIEQLDKGHKMSPQMVEQFFKQTKAIVHRDLNPTYRINNDAAIMRYKYFFPDKFDYIFSNIEKHCGIVIPEEQKQEIKDTYNLEQNKKRSNAAGSSFKLIGDKLIHGNHVYKGTIGWWKDVVPNILHNYVNSILGHELNQWKYDI